MKRGFHNKTQHNSDHFWCVETWQIDQSCSFVRTSVKHWARGLLTWRPVRTPQLQKVQASMSVTYHRESEQNSPSVLVTQDRQPLSPEALIRFQRLPGFRLLRKHATALTTLYRAPWSRAGWRHKRTTPLWIRRIPFMPLFEQKRHTKTGVIFITQPLLGAKPSCSGDQRGSYRMLRCHTTSVANLPDPSTFSVAPCQS